MNIVIMSDCDIQDDNNNAIEIQNNCKSEEDIMNLIKIIDKRELSSIQIMKKYNISSYRFYKILREYDLKTIKHKPGRTGPKNTKFKQLLYGSEEQQKAAKIFPEGFVIHDFITDSKNSMKLTDLMEKYKLTLYQIRELRKQYDLKTK